MRAGSQGFLRYPLSTLFSSPANIRVLRELATVGGELTATEITDRSRLSKPSVLASLEHMMSLGFVEAIGPRRQRLYRMDDAYPICEELKALFKAEYGRFDKITKTIFDAGKDLGVLALWVYGSVVRSEDRPDSDLDVAIIVDEDAERHAASIREALRDFQDRMRFSLSVVCFDRDEVLQLAAEHDPLWESFVEEDRLIPLIGGTPQALLAKLRKRKNAA